jgi:hypothetical protein
MKWIFHTPPIVTAALVVALMAVPILLPVSVNFVHDRVPVYAPVIKREIVKEGDTIKFRGVVRKLHECTVKLGRAYVNIRWQEPDGSTGHRTLELLDENGELALIGPSYRAGDDAALRWFSFNVSHVAERDRISEFYIMLPCRRWSFYDVIAEIGPWEIRRD